jgi:hypothetical protein
VGFTPLARGGSLKSDSFFRGPLKMNHFSLAQDLCHWKTIQFQRATGK